MTRPFRAGGKKIRRRRFRETDARIPRCPLINPRAEQADLLRRQPFAFLGHEAVRIEARDQFNHAAFCAFARDNGWTGFAALEQRGAVLNAELALGSSAAVAFDATRLKDRLDLPGKIDFVVRRRRESLRLVRSDFGECHTFAEPKQSHRK